MRRKAKPVVPRSAAHVDVEQAIDHYQREAGSDVALRFIGALKAAFAHIGRHPASGSPRLALELKLAELRSWPLKRFPHLVFYVERPDHIDVWRVLHGQRDLPAWLREPPDGG